jgi:hypothetical protein
MPVLEDILHVTQMFHIIRYSTRQCTRLPEQRLQKKRAGMLQSVELIIMPSRNMQMPDYQNISEQLKIILNHRDYFVKN